MIISEKYLKLKWQNSYVTVHNLHFSLMIFEMVHFIRDANIEIL